jgi:hypothetical protein
MKNCHLSKNLSTEVLTDIQEDRTELLWNVHGLICIEQVRLIKDATAWNRLKMMEELLMNYIKGIK